MDLCSGEEGDTPLHVTTACGDEKMAHLLLGNGGVGNKETQNKLGRMAFDVARKEGMGDYLIC